MENEEDEDSKPLRDRLAKFLSGKSEQLFTLTVLLTIVFIANFCENKVSGLDIYFLLITLCGFFLKPRSAVLGSLMAILVVSFFVVLNPTAYAENAPNGELFTRLLLWGSCLVLTAAIVGTMSEQLRNRFGKAWRTLEQFNTLQDQLSVRQEDLEDRNRALIAAKARLESVLHYTMDPVVAQLIIAKKLENEKRDITVMFADLQDFTANAEDMPPELVVRNLNRLFSDMEPILSRFRGHLDKYIGDGLMAEFGVPYFARHHPLLAVSAALRMQEHMRRRDFPWRMRIGIANGLSLVGLVGSENRKNYTAVGDIVNLSARLQSLCPPGSICVDRNTYRYVAPWCNVRPLRPALSPRDIDLFERAQASNDPVRQDALEEDMVKAFLHEEEEGYVAVKGKKEQVAIYEILGFLDPLENYLRVPREAAELYHRLRPQVLLPDESVLTLEALEGSIGHGRVTAALAVALAERMGLDERAQKDLLMAAQMHDIGKLSVPEALLNEARRFGDMSPADQELMRGHAAAAERVLREMNVPVSPQMLDAIRQHHERFGGGGYPDGLQGTQISLLARILQLADEYEALTSSRSYREKLDLPHAIEVLRQDVEEGKFDPKVAEQFLKMLESATGLS